MKKYLVPDIPENEQSPLVKSLLLLLEQSAERLQKLEEENARLKDEINILKGEKKRPVFKGSKLEEKTEKSQAEGKTEATRQRAGSRKRAKTSKLTIHQEQVVAPDEPVPAGSRFKGYREFVVQDILIQPHNTRYKLERWVTPQGITLTGSLPEGAGHFGDSLIRYVLYQYHHCHTTQPLLLEQLREWGIDISSGQIDRILTADKGRFHQEKEAVLVAGLRSDYVTVDDSGARHRGKNGFVTHMGNDLFGWFCSTDSKSRLNFLTLLRGKARDYLVNEAGLNYMRRQKLPKWARQKLQSHTGRWFSDELQWKTVLEKEGIHTLKHQRIATEGALIASILAHNGHHDMAIISDDAGQFNVMSHGLCWVHAERLVHKLTPFNESHRADLRQVRNQIWTYYKKLKAYKKQPSAAVADELSTEFDGIFTQKTRFATLNQTLQRLFRNKEELLLVLKKPEVPLHTNGSERDIRDYVKKRKISGGTRSDEGRRCRDTFASLKKTCRKLGISFWDYLGDRLTEGIQTIPSLADIIRRKLTAPG